MATTSQPQYFRFEEWMHRPGVLPSLKSNDSDGIKALIEEALWLAYQQGFRDRDAVKHPPAAVGPERQ